MFRYHHGPHYDLHGTGGSEGPAEGDLSHGSGLFRLHLLHVHFLHRRSGETPPTGCQINCWLILKFGLVHHFTKMGSGEYYLEELENEICRKNDLDKSEKKRYRKSSFSLTKTVRYQFIIILQDILFTKWREVRKAFLLHALLLASERKRLRGTHVRERQS